MANANHVIVNGETILDLRSDTVTPETLRKGYKAHDKSGAVIDGTMPDNGEVSATMDGLSVTSVAIAAGYTSGGTVSLTNTIETALAAI